MIVFEPTALKVWYYKADLTATVGNAVLLYTGITIRESVFAGTSTGVVNGNTIPQSFSAGYAGQV